MLLFRSHLCTVPHDVTTTSSPSATTESSATPPANHELTGESALVPTLLEPEATNFMQLSEPVARLPVELDVAIPVRGFRVRNLLTLETGQVIESQWNHGGDVPLASGEVQLAWSEFEVMESQLAVRVTRLA